MKVFLSLIVLLSAVTPSLAGPFIRFNSRGLSKNERIYSVGAGNEHMEFNCGVDTTGDVSSNLIARIRF